MPITDEVREKIDEAADKHGFRVPYDGSNSFYDDTAVKSFQAGGEYGYSLALAELEVLKAENERLKQWKKEAMPMMEDFQTIGKALGIPLGQSIHDKILPGIEAKDKRIAELEGLVDADKRELLGAFMTFFLQEGEMTCDDRTRKYYVDKFIWNKIL